MSSPLPWSLAPILVLAAAELRGQVQWRLSSAAGPSPRSEAGQAYDAARDVTVLFGGFQTLPGGTVTPTDVSEWDGQAWTVMQAPGGPAGEFHPVMGADPAGGISVYSNWTPNRLWRWDGSAWTQQTAASDIGSRHHAAMALDPVRNRLVLFGGLDATLNNDLAETWEWDGAAWTQVLTAAVPPGRSMHSMAFDAVSGEVVMTGGVADLYAASIARTDTWTFDGARWRQLSSVGAAPTPSLSFDSVRGRLVQVASAIDVREWVGGVWVQRSPAVPPGACASIPWRSAVFHQGSGQVVALMGCPPAGQVSPGSVETWVYGPTTPATVTPFGSSCPGSAGIAALRAAPMPGNLPWLGRALTVEIDRRAVVTAAIFAFGSSRSVWAGGALPTSLAGVGMPGCDLLVSPDLVEFVASARTTLRIPAIPTLLGMPVYAQAAVFDPLANRAGLVTTNGLELVLGGL